MAVAEWSKAVNKHSPTLLTIRPMPCSLSLPSMILMSPPLLPSPLLRCRRAEEGSWEGIRPIDRIQVDVGTRGKPPLSNPSTSVRALSAGGRGEIVWVFVVVSLSLPPLSRPLLLPFDVDQRGSGWARRAMGKEEEEEER